MIRNISMTLFSVVLLTSSIYGQEFADPKIYLIDSLDYNNLPESDKELIDNSLKEYRAAKNDTLKILAVNVIIDQTWNDNVWVPYNEWAYEFAKAKQSESKNDKELRFYQITQANALNNKGLYFNSTGQIDRALSSLKEAAKLLELLKDEKGLSASYNNIGAIYDSQGDIISALDYYHRSLKLKEEINDSIGVANSLNNIGWVYYSQNDFKRALEYYNKSLNIRRAINDQRGISNSLNNIALTYVNQGDTSTALKHYHESLKIREEIGFTNGAATSYNNIGWIYYLQNDYDIALEYLQKGLKLAEQVNAQERLALIYTNLGVIYLAKNNITKSLQYGHKGYEISKNLGFPGSIEKSSSLLKEIYERKKNFQKAYYFYQEEVAMRDSIINESNYREAQQQQAKYEYEKKQAELEKQQALKDAQYEKQLALEKLRKNKQRTITYFAFGGLVLVIAFLVFAFNRLKITRRQKNEIDRQKKELQNTHEQLAQHHDEIASSIVYAKRIQEAIMPSMKAMTEALENGFVMYLPKDVVAGDFFWMESTDEAVYFAAADCTGHGVPGAMVSVVCSNALNKALLEEGIRDTGKLLDRTKQIVIERLAKSGEEVKDGMDISLCSLNRKTKKLQWSGANNPLWIIRRGTFNQELTPLENRIKTEIKDSCTLVDIRPDKQPIGKYASAQPFTSVNIDLETGDRLYLFTDGYQDQFGGPKGKKLKTRQFKNLLIDHQDKSMNMQKQIIQDYFYYWMGSLEQVDDVCVIGVEIG
ncbi:MAG: tetratricopeptide repeat protein [Crocinitomicaceae bacterium]|nr:tetratricopeptide repeat protein [Crocinitomicaceae bacterium]